MRILIIEDQAELNLQMKEAMEDEGYYVDAALNGVEGEDKAICNEYDAILLDLNLPDKDGLKVLQELRKQGITAPVLIISARDALDDRIQGLKLGADDYIIKPFDMQEISARLQAVIRRTHGHSTNVLSIEKLRLDLDQRTAFYNNKEILLAKKEFDILAYLMIRYPAIVSSEAIAEHVYDENFNPFSSVLRVHMARLKNKLQEVGERELLKTIRGEGYQLCLKQK